MISEPAWDAQKIGTLRDQMGLTVEQFARRIGVTTTTAMRWLTGTTEPSPLAREKLKALEREVAA